MIRFCINTNEKMKWKNKCGYICLNRTQAKRPYHVQMCTGQKLCSPIIAFMHHFLGAAGIQLQLEFIACVSLWMCVLSFLWCDSGAIDMKPNAPEKRIILYIHVVPFIHFSFSGASREFNSCRLEILKDLTRFICLSKLTGVSLEDWRVK